MSFKEKIDMVMEAAVRKPLVEANLKVSHFTGKVADKKGFTMKKIGSSNPGAVVMLQGDEKAILAYAKKYLGADPDAKTLSDVQSDVYHPSFGVVLDKDFKDESKKMDPVGQADADIDNDGDVDDSDEYLKKRRAAISKAMKKEGYESADDTVIAKEMKKLHASNCSKQEMYKQLNAQYGCSKEKFEQLYASNCMGESLTIERLKTRALSKSFK